MKKISMAEAKASLTELVREAEAGHEVILTRHGHPVVRLTPIRPHPDRKARHMLLQRVRVSARRNRTAGPSAARSQDFLYGKDGLPH
ncbi:MAG: type II toxin-antitoxin system Phd/YefM family antitoxin [Terriglobales bacterium]